jgi:predicted transcriptional regulator of viral defense system
LRALIAGQRDVLTAAQALDLGFTRQSISRRSKSGEWQRVLPGTYVVGTRPPDFLQSAMVGLLWGGPSAVLSHFAAASLWKLVDRPDRVELWIPRARHLRTTELIVHRGSVGANDRRILGGFPVTAPAKTVVELCIRPR